MGTRAHYWQHVLDSDGEPVVGATVNVYDQGTTTPVTPTIYAGDTGVATTQSNPLTTDSSGKFEIWLDDPLRCDVKVSGTGFNAYTETIDVTKTPNDGAAGQDGTISLIRDAGVDMTARGKLNFTDGFDLADDAANDETEVALDFGTGATQAAQGSHTHAIDDLSDVDLTGIAAGSTLYWNGTNLIDLGIGTASQVLTVNTGATAPEWADASGGGGATIVRKTADESVTSSTTLQDDNHLLFAIASNEVQIFEVVVFHRGATTGDIKFAFTTPSGATLIWNIVGAYSSADSFQTPFAAEVSGGDIQQGTGGTGGSRTTFIKGLCANGATAGNVTLRWAQTTSDGTATTVKANSFLLHQAVS